MTDNISVDHKLTCALDGVGAPGHLRGGTLGAPSQACDEPCADVGLSEHNSRLCAASHCRTPMWRGGERTFALCVFSIAHLGLHSIGSGRRMAPMPAGGAKVGISEAGNMCVCVE